MNKNILIVLGGAVLVAFLMAVLVQMMLGGRGDKMAVKEEAKVEILVASKDLRIGQELASGDMKWQSWPKGNLFGGAVVREKEQKPEEALKGRLRRDVADGEPILKTYMLGESKGNVVAASLEPGMRAVSIEVSAETMVAGFITAGDFVDVILTYKTRFTTDDDDPRVGEMINRNIDKSAIETILENVRVLAVDQTAQRPEEGKIKVGKTVTLALSPEDSERVILARDMGPLTLALRGIGDKGPIDKTWPIISDKRLISMDDDLYEKYKNLKNDSGIQTDNVRIYSGNGIQVIPARQ
jgi:pilus assembly protein CpaB